MSSNNILTSATSTEVTVSVVIVTILILLVICNLLMYTVTRMLTDPKFCLRQMVQRYTQKVPRVRVLEVHPKPRTPSLIGQSHADLISLLSHSANLQLDNIPRETTPTLQPDSASAEIIHFSTLQDDGFTREITPVYMKEETWKENMTIKCEMQKVESVREKVTKQAKSDRKGDIQKMTGGITLVADSNLPPSRKRDDVTDKLEHENQQKENGQNPNRSLPIKSQVLSSNKDNRNGVQSKVSKKGIKSLPKGGNSPNVTYADSEPAKAGIKQGNEILPRGGNSPNTTYADSEPATSVKQDNEFQGQTLPTESRGVVRQRHDEKCTAEKEGCTDRVRDKEACTDKLTEESDNISEKSGINTTSATENCQESSDTRLDTGPRPKTSAETNVGKISNPPNETETNVGKISNPLNGTGTKPETKHDSNIGQEAGSDDQQIILINNYDTPVIKFFKEMKKEIVETTEEMMVNDGLVIDESELTEGQTDEQRGQEQGKNRNQTQTTEGMMVNDGLVIDESERTEGQTNEKKGQEQGKNRNQMDINSDIGGDIVTERRVQDGQIDRDNERDEQGTAKNSSAAFENQERNDLNRQNAFNTEKNGNDIHNSDIENPVSSAKGDGMTEERTNTEYKSVSYDNEVNTQMDMPDSGSASTEGCWEGKQSGTSSSAEKKDGDQNKTKESSVVTVEGQINTHTVKAVDTATLNEQIKTEEISDELQLSGDNNIKTEREIKEETLSDKSEDSKSSETDIEKDLNEYIRSNTMETNSDDRVNDKLDDNVEEASVKDVKPKTKRSKQEPVTTKTKAVRARNLAAVRTGKRFKQLKLTQ